MMLCASHYWPLNNAPFLNYITLPYIKKEDLFNNHSFMVTLYNINIEERCIVQRANSVMLCGKSCSIITTIFFYAPFLYIDIIYTIKEM